MNKIHGISLNYISWWQHCRDASFAVPVITGFTFNHFLRMGFTNFRSFQKRWRKTEFNPVKTSIEALCHTPINSEVLKPGGKAGRFKDIRAPVSFLFILPTSSGIPALNRKGCAEYKTVLQNERIVRDGCWENWIPSTMYSSLYCVMQNLIFRIFLYSTFESAMFGW